MNRQQRRIQDKVTKDLRKKRRKTFPESRWFLVVLIVAMSVYVWVDNFIINYPAYFKPLIFLAVLPLIYWLWWPRLVKATAGKSLLKLLLLRAQGYGWVVVYLIPSLLSLLAAGALLLMFNIANIYMHHDEPGRAEICRISHARSGKSLNVYYVYRDELHSASANRKLTETIEQAPHDWQVKLNGHDGWLGSFLIKEKTILPADIR